MGGILKNPLTSKEEAREKEPESISEFRKQVYKNTQLNAKLTAHENGESIAAGAARKHVLPRDTLSLKHDSQHVTAGEEERLQWNQRNLDANEVAKQQFQDIHIDEPKTPYQGAVDPSGEYYALDEDDDLDQLSLGEPEVELANARENEMPVVETASENETAPENGTAPDDVALKHKRFEEMRKKHYNVGGALKDRLRAGIEGAEEEEEEEEEEEGSDGDN
ncbi:LAMI_0F16094g1_1 [Lachancea mirantina]|uniref:LAMI_0F16094g1_1 n=1 Tax=Lachancea mirantina TaxID=1230905 RepID=A0A1G4K500_9SACH|nr:LAMI_0F16094g1_1 [Lachancea mirantina]